jgi:hypothetical protein
MDPGGQASTTDASIRDPVRAYVFGQKMGTARGRIIVETGAENRVSMARQANRTPPILLQ